MSKNTIEKQQERLEKIEKQIKEAIDRKLGYEFIKAAGTDYTELGRSDIKPLAEELAEIYNKSQTNHTANSFNNEVEHRNEV
ncbi:putative uncharacterized protein [Tetragenococcus halophilus subsp. halophilus]|uniref:hypothetical protein n=1 Tax=Tetragenococcus halophilus TaxID=51669 RepID=UPI000CAC0341|nr:hypothetical protein [Tetragenococcus halophilus]GBD82632.1 putative uncharacterized protein [Tetragenococcus halophilus subsp. halophilus]